VGLREETGEVKVEVERVVAVMEMGAMGLEGEGRARVVAVKARVEEGMEGEVRAKVGAVRGMGVVGEMEVVERVKGVVEGMEVVERVGLERGEEERVMEVVEMVVKEKVVVVKEGGWVGKGWVGAVHPVQEGEVVGCVALRHRGTSKH
jgi:hypothetical protein